MHNITLCEAQNITNVSRNLYGFRGFLLLKNLLWCKYGVDYKNKDYDI